MDRDQTGEWQEPISIFDFAPTSTLLLWALQHTVNVGDPWVDPVLYMHSSIAARQCWQAFGQRLLDTDDGEGDPTSA